MDSLLDNGNKKKSRRLNLINVALSVIIVLLVLVIITLLFFVTPMSVSGRSMYPTYDTGDKVLLAKVGYSLDRGDVIVFRIPDNDSPPIKRIVGLPGDVIYFDIDKMDYTVNGKPIDDYAEKTGYDSNYFMSGDKEVYAALTTTGITVGENQLFVLGDNRNDSLDSHIYGCIEQDWIVGKVILNY